MKKTRTISLFLLGLLAFSQGSQAEISGSGSPNSGCLGQLSGYLWQDWNGNGVADAGEPGLTDIDVKLVQDEESHALGATTNSAGYYEFTYLCNGGYVAVVDDSTVPDDTIDTDSVSVDSNEELGGWYIEIDELAGESPVPVNIGSVDCDLRVSSRCIVSSLASELYVCEKPIDVLSLIWAGEETIRIVAHYGKHDDPVVADIDNITPGDVVSVSGFSGSPDDVVWEIFVAGSDTKLGESKFRMDCDDELMNGPEDCSLRQGNGKDDKVDLINGWLLEGIVDDSGLLECNRSGVPAKTCEVQSTYADCEIIDKVNWLTFSYSGGDCDDSVHDQPDKFECTGAVSDQQPVTVLTESGDSFSVRPGGSFTIPVAGSDTDIVLDSPSGRQALRIHTSCSKPLAAGDVFGGLTLAAMNGIGLGAQIDFEYEFDNRGEVPAIAVAREAPMRTLFEPVIAVDGNSTRVVAGSAYVMRSSASALLAESSNGGNPMCNGADLVSIIVNPRLPCEISGSGWQIHDDYILWDLGAGSEVSATIDRINISWPDSVTDKLKEIKLDGDKIFDQDRYGGATSINKSDLEGELHKRSITGNQSKQLKIVFDDSIDTVSPDDFNLEVEFRQGCAIAR